MLRNLKNSIKNNKSPIAIPDRRIDKNKNNSQNKNENGDSNKKQETKLNEKKNDIQTALDSICGSRTIKIQSKIQKIITRIKKPPNLKTQKP